MTEKDYNEKIGMFQGLSSHSKGQITYLYTAGLGIYKRKQRKTRNRQKNKRKEVMQQNQLTVIANVLTKMANFFNDIAQQCIQQLTSQEQSSISHNLKPKIQVPQQQQLSQRQDKGFKSHKPKHPVSSFFIFYKEKGQQIAKQRGEVLGSKIAKIVGELWKGMSEVDKEPYEAQAKLARQKYQKEMAHYKINYTDEIAKLKRLKRLARLKRKQKEDSLPPTQLLKIQQGVSQEQQMVLLQDSESQEDELAQGLSDVLSDSIKEGSIIHRQPKQPIKQEKQQGKEDSLPAKQQHQNHHKQDEGSLSEVDILDDSIDSLTSSPSPRNSIKNKLNQQPKQQPVTKQKDKTKEKQQFAEDAQVVKPKGPISSFFFFYKANKNQIAEEYGMTVGPKAIKKASQLWKALSSEQKEIYELQAKQTRVQYYRKMDQFKKQSGEKKISSKKAKKKKQKKQK